VATERTIKHPDGRVERVSENSTGPTIVEQRRSGGGMGGVIALIVGLALVLIIGWFLMNMNRNEAIESNAVAGAAESVGNAADNIGEAARDAVPERATPAN
jgi:predicted lipid-binding transport protein (Tim44 family)